MSVNKVILLGNLGNDPETRFTAQGVAVTNASLATSRTWKDKNTGEKQEHTEWHRLVFFNRRAEVAGEYLKKGSKIYVEGSLKTNKWQDKDGSDRYTTEIIVDVMDMLDGKGDNKGDNKDTSQSYQSNLPPKVTEVSNDEVEEEDIPF